MRVPTPLPNWKSPSLISSYSTLSTGEGGAVLHIVPTPPKFLASVTIHPSDLAEDVAVSMPMLAADMAAASRMADVGPGMVTPPHSQIKHDRIITVPTPSNPNQSDGGMAVNDALHAV